MKSMSVKLTWMLLPMIAACGDDGKTSPSLGKDRYQVEVDPLFHDEAMTVSRLTVTARGKRVLTVTGGGKSQTLTQEPEPNSANDQITFEVVCIGNLVRPTQGDWHLTWMTLIRGDKTLSGGPIRMSVKPASKVEEVFRFDARAGEHSVGETVNLGELRGGAVTLKVE